MDQSSLYAKRWPPGDRDPFDGLLIRHGRVRVIWGYGSAPSKTRRWGVYRNRTNRYSVPSDQPWKPDFKWRLSAGLIGGKGFVFVPLWLPVMFLAAVTWAAWWSGRVPRGRGFCRKCGYNLTGNVSGRCPECGEGVQQRTHNSYSQRQR